MARALRIVSLLASPPTLTTATSPPNFSLDFNASSIAYSSYGFTTKVTPVGSINFQVELILIFDVVSGT